MPYTRLLYTILTACFARNLMTCHSFQLSSTPQVRYGKYDHSLLHIRTKSATLSSICFAIIIVYNNEDCCVSVCLPGNGQCSPGKENSRMLVDMSTPNGETVPQGPNSPSGECFIDRYTLICFSFKHTHSNILCYYFFMLSYS